MRQGPNQRRFGLSSSADYIFYIILKIFVSCGGSVKEFFLLRISHNRQPSLSAPCIFSPITPQSPPSRSNTDSVYPPIFDTFDWMEMKTSIPLYRLMNLYCQTSALLRGCKPDPLLQIQPLLIPLPLQLTKPSKTIITGDPSGCPCRPNPPNVLPPMRSIERPPCPHTTSQSQNSQNYHFHLGLLSASDPPDHHY